MPPGQSRRARDLHPSCGIVKSATPPSVNQGFTITVGFIIANSDAAITAGFALWHTVLVNMVPGVIVIFRALAFSPVFAVKTVA